jgi:acetyl-CoA acetyltransferase
MRLAASRHMHQYGTTREHLAEVAVAARKWAQLNPVAWEKKPLTVADVLKSRMISYPFTVRDCCLVTDGGGAIVMTSAERAKSLKKPPGLRARLWPTRDASRHLVHADLTVTGAKPAGEAAYKMAKLSAKDCDMVQLYDAFTINTVLFLGRPRLLPEGRGRGVRVGRQYRAGRQAAVNTNGGGLSYCHPGMYGPVHPDRGRTPAARRMRRAAGEEARCRDGARQWRRAVRRRRA